MTGPAPITIQGTAPLYVHTHLGLGDHICTNAIIRHLARTRGSVHLICKMFNLDNVRRLYLGNAAVVPAPIPLDQRVEAGEMQLVQEMVQSAGGTLLRIGHKPPYLHDDPVSPDERFYQQMGLDYELRFNDFHIERDMEAEERVFQSLNPSGEPYAFIQSDEQWPLQKEWGDLSPVFNDPSIPFFNLGLTLERAAEVHLPNSSIRCLIEGRRVYDMSKARLFFHDLRAPIWGDSTRLDWSMVHYG